VSRTSNIFYATLSLVMKDSNRQFSFKQMKININATIHITNFFISGDILF
jgi:hypothetical protein